MIKNDILRITTPAMGLKNTVDGFTIQFESRGEKQGVMKLAWDKTVVEVPFKL